MSGNKWSENSGLKWPKRTKKVLFKSKKKEKKPEEDEQSEIQRLIGQRATFDASTAKSFKDFPFSKRTLEGLKAQNYMKPTEIQKEAIGLALRGMDILGAAKTGSGKTLAFLIPIMEILYSKLWTKTDGLGALVITPTRELAYQIFETLRKVGCRHEFSAALVIGGKDLKFERKRMDKVNILICTPGRLLQHMDENSMFDCLSLQILVLDEADRCLDMGFQEAMNAIIANLPEDRQTLLFSATQTKSVKDLARLSLKSPVYVSVHENSVHSTPESLQQSYIVCPLDSKLDILWSFLRHHKRSKILVFLSSCKQVRFIHMLFRRMRPSVGLLALYGSLHQLKRMQVYEEFCKKQVVVLFATDIAARGLDFPAVDWVIQLDCPEDATTYIHRVGRTARYNKNGEALIILLPSEEKGALAELQEKKIPIEKIEVNPKKIMTVRRKFEALLARDVNLKECAQRAFKSYLKSVFLMKNKGVFDVTALDLPSFASSLGLAVAPRVRFLQKKLEGMDKKSKKKGGSSEPIINDDSDHSDLRIQLKSKPNYDFSVESGDSDGEDLFASKKLATLDFSEPEDNGTEGADNLSVSVKSKKQKTKMSVAKKLLKKKIQVNKKCNFDEDGEAILDGRREKQSDLAKDYEKEDVSGIDIDKAKQVLRLEDKYDKELFRERIRARHREERLKAKMERKGGRRDNIQDPEEREFSGDEDEEEHVVKIGKRSEENEYSSDESGSYTPNLDWLPDPDRIYGPAGSDDDNESESHYKPEPDSDSETPQYAQVAPTDKLPKKRKIDEEVTFKKSFKQPKNKISKALKSGKNLDGALMEELALKLLQE